MTAGSLAVALRNLGRLEREKSETPVAADAPGPSLKDFLSGILIQIAVIGAMLLLLWIL
jgi:hypothetical protein